MAEYDYRALGLKAGLECHQQLDTGKLFCRCPSILREEKPDFAIRRSLRAVASELGEYDAAALEAQRKGLAYIYEGYNDTTCLIEADEEPPKNIDSEALKTILKITLMVGAKVPDVLQVMRKTVIDGSNTSGFQRTLLVALGGEIKLKNKTVDVQTIILEEDAARPMQKGEKEITYRLDRMGIPLIELATAPQLESPEEVKECALAIGNIFRLTGKAKRGLGTIRQDLNVSIARGARVEIKGVQELGKIDEYVKREIQRQMKLLELREEMKRRNIFEEDFWEGNAKAAELTEIFRKTESKIIANAFQKEQAVVGVKLGKMRGLLGFELQPNRRFATEIANYLNARTGIGGLIHSDELPNYGVSNDEIEKIRLALNIGKDDAFAFACCNREIADDAINVILGRCRQAFNGVPEETRNALEDGNTEYSRPLPGAARMYPETDLQAIRIDGKMLNALKKELPLTAEQRMELYTKKGLGGQLAEKMLFDNYAPFYESLLGKGIDATSAAALLLEGIVQLRRNGIEVEKITNEMIEEALLALQNRKITKELMLDLLAEWSKFPDKKLDEIIAGMKVEKMAESEIENIIKGILESNSKLIEEKKENAFSALMGEAMQKLKGRASGAEISGILRAELQKILKGKA